MTVVTTLLCPRCYRSVTVEINVDNEAEWYELSRISRRLRDHGHKVTVPLLPQLMEPEDRN